MEQESTTQKDIDALKSKIDSMNEAMHSIARRQVALEEEAEERQSIGLRERLLESALRGVSLAKYDKRGSESLGRAAVWMVDAAIAAMRKENTKTDIIASFMLSINEVDITEANINNQSFRERKLD